LLLLEPRLVHEAERVVAMSVQRLRCSGDRSVIGASIRRYRQPKGAEPIGEPTPGNARESGARPLLLQ
jgi:hypothetical protein